MSYRFNRPCKRSICGNVTRNQSGYCDKCMNSHPHLTKNNSQSINQSMDTRNVDTRTQATNTTRRTRPNANARGYGHKWRKAREQYLKENPLCIFHSKRGQYVPATVVDHIKPHKGDMKLFWRRSNWQPLCHSCHSSEKQRIEYHARNTVVDIPQ